MTGSKMRTEKIELSTEAVGKVQRVAVKAESLSCEHASSPMASLDRSFSKFVQRAVQTRKCNKLNYFFKKSTLITTYVTQSTHTSSGHRQDGQEGWSNNKKMVSPAVLRQVGVTRRNDGNNTGESRKVSQSWVCTSFEDNGRQAITSKEAREAIIGAIGVILSFSLLFLM